MSHKANLRRLKALTVLVAPALFMAGTVAVGPVYAQGAPPSANKPQQKIPAGEPLGKRKPDTGQRKVGKVGSWSYASEQNYAGAHLLPEKIKTRSGGKRVGGRLLGGQAEIKIEYWSIPGPKHGFSGDLVVSSRGNLGGFKTHVFVDGKEVDSFTMGGMGRAGTQRRDLKKLFGKNLEGLAKARNIRVTIDTGGKTYDIFEVDLQGTAELFAAMRRRPDANFAANNPNRTSGPGDVTAFGPTGPSSWPGQLGSRDHGVGGTPPKARGAEPKIRSADCAKVPSFNLNRPQQKDGTLGSWSYKFLGSGVHSELLPEKIKTTKGGELKGKDKQGGTAELRIWYSAPPGPKHGFKAWISVIPIGKYESFRADLFADGEKIDTVTFETETNPKTKKKAKPYAKSFDLKKLYADDMERVARVRNLRIAADMDGTSFDIFEADIEGTAELIEKMKTGADAYYAPIAARKACSSAPDKQKPKKAAAAKKLEKPLGLRKCDDLDLLYRDIDLNTMPPCQP